MKLRTGNFIALLFLALCVKVVPLAGQTAPPVLTAVTNAGSYADHVVSPGEMVVLFGERLGPKTITHLQLGPNLTLRTSLANVQVLADGTPCPLIYVSETQISAMMPYQIAGRATTKVQVVTNGIASNVVEKAVAPSIPGIFTADSSGKGQAAMTNADGRLNSQANPAQRGQWVTFYLTGEGEITPAGKDGALILSTTQINLPVAVRVGGRVAELLYAGSAPGNVSGFAQINARIPADLPYGGDLPLIVQVGSAESSREVTVAVAGAAAPKPAVPTNLMLSFSGGMTIVASWNGSGSNTTHYMLERADDGGKFREIAVLNASQTTYSDEGLGDAQSWRYRVRAYNDWGFSGYSSEVQIERPAPPPAMEISVTPSAATLIASQTQQLTALVMGDTGGGVSWTLTPSFGTLSTSGTSAVYTAPSTIEVQQTVTVEVRSNVNPAVFAKALFTLIPTVAISVSPQSVTVPSGETKQFVASVTGTTNKGVTWSVNPSIGAINAQGLYTAPATVSQPVQVQIIAKAQADTTKTAKATVTVAPKVTDGVQFTVGPDRLTSLTYKGKSYLNSEGHIMRGATFRSPSGSESQVGWIAPSSKSHGEDGNQKYLEHTYDGGPNRQFKLRVVWSSPQPDTIRADAYVTNLSSSETLTGISLFILPFQIPGPAREYNQNIPITLDQYGGKPAQLLSGEWGSLAFWMEGYPTNASLLAHYGSADLTVFSPTIASNARIGPQDVVEETIAPSQTKVFSQVIRFGNSDAVITELAAEAYEAYRKAFPYSVKWPDRRPIGTWFISEGTKRSTTNPRGYLWEETLNISNSTAFRQAVLARADAVIQNMNAMTPRPQGLIIWDLEGQEFDHAFTYVGSPDKLSELAPEMNQVADELFAKFAAAGYLTGVTLRPQVFGTGTTLPSTCNSDGAPYRNDKFIKLDAPYPFRAYRCVGGTWQVTSLGPGAQTSVESNGEILKVLRKKVIYARQRWGARLFYVDTNVYASGGPISVSIWRQLAEEFPDCLFFPELETANDWSVTAPYNQANMNMFLTPSSVLDLYPQAFSLINVADINFQTYHDVLVRSVKEGNILLFRAWFPSPEIPYVQAIYQEASQR